MTNDGSLVRSLTWVARLVAADTLGDARRLAGVLGMTVLADEPTKLMLQAPGGDVLEYVTGDDAAASYLFAGQDTVVGFLVADLEATAEALAAAGFPALSDAAGDGPVRFQHVRGPGGVAYGLIHQTA